jgi:hypothetical protein
MSIVKGIFSTFANIIRDMRRFATFRISYGCSTYKTIKTAVDSTLKSYTITLSNAPKRNTLSHETLTEISRAIDNVHNHVEKHAIKVYNLTDVVALYPVGRPGILIRS